MTQMKLELVLLPVTDVDKAKAFYVDQVGFGVDVDVDRGGMRIVQLTPPGSACSITLSKGIAEIDALPPGSVKSLHLLVLDVAEARAELISRGVEVDEIEEHDGGSIKYARFADPDGNTWALQEMAWRMGDAF